MAPALPEGPLCDVVEDESWAPPRLTGGALFVLGAMYLIDCINVNLLIAYVDRLVSELTGRPPDDPQVVQLVGLLVGSYSLCEVVFSPFWGFLADRVGRRPVLLIGLGGTVVAPVLFGLSHSLLGCFLARGLDGFFCGNLGVTKTYMGEVVDATNEAKGFSTLSMCYSFGIILGPVLGGQLVEPAKWAPAVFGGTIFERYPYLLPNLTYAAFGAVSWMLGFLFLEETLPPAARRWRLAAAPKAAGHEATPGAACLSWAAASPGRPARWRKVILLIFTYCLLTGYYTTWLQNVVVIVSLPREAAGFGYGPHEIGMILNASAVGLLVMQLCLYTRLTRRFGFVRCYAAGCLGSAAVSLAFPLYGMTVDARRATKRNLYELGLMMCLGQCALGLCFPTVTVWFNRALDGLDRATWNGWCNSLGALFRAVFPPAADGLLSVGLRSGLEVGRYLPVFANTLAGLGSLALAVAALGPADRPTTPRQLARPEPPPSKDAKAPLQEPLLETRQEEGSKGPAA